MISRQLQRVASSFLRSALLVVLVGLAGCYVDDAPPQVRVSEGLLSRSTPADSRIAFETITDIEPLSDSLLLVSVDGGRELWVVGWDGDRRHVASRRGKGPGEVQGAAWIGRVAPDLFCSVDVILRRISLYAGDGRYIRGWGYDFPSVTGVWAFRDRLVLRTTASSSSMDFLTLDTDGVLLDSKRMPSLAESSTESCRYCPAAVRSDGAVVLAVSDTSYRLIVKGLSSDSSLFVQGPPEPALLAPQADRDSIAALWRSIAGRLRERGLPPEALANVDAIARSPGRSFLPRFIGRTALFSDSGEFFIQRTAAAGDSAVVDRFSRNLEYVRSIRLPSGSQLRRVYGETLLVTRALGNGSTVVEEYSVQDSR